MRIDARGSQQALRPPRWMGMAAAALALATAVGGAGASGDRALAATGTTSATATVTARASTPSPAGVTDRALQTPLTDLGAQWTGVAAGDWVQLDWAGTQSVTSVQLFGAPAAAASIASGTLTFSDGSSLLVGGVLRDGVHPTTIAFPSKSIDWMRFTADRLSGSGSSGIGELAVYRAGSTPQKSLTATGAPSTGIGVPVSTEIECLPRPAASGLTVLCPTSNSFVHGPTSMRVFAPGASAVVARVWQNAGGAYPDPVLITAIPDASSIATVSFDASRLTHGPFTVEVRSMYYSRVLQTAYAQLFNASGAQTARLLPGSHLSSPSTGMTLAFSEEFTSQVSLSRTGIGADYTSTQPFSNGGAQEFGEAIFANPSAELDNISVVDDDFLRIALSPRPPSFPDPMGWNRDHIGGMLSSARVGGSGFSAQYGYFEARMLVPGGKGLWPAFWMLPSGNLAEKQAVVAEIDAVESYGHDPTYNCQGTHSYVGGKDTSKIQCTTKFDSIRSGLAWHTYGAKLGKETITYFIDGEQVATAPQVPGGDVPMFFMANLALSSDWAIDLAATGDEAAMYVDYIRVYT